MNHPLALNYYALMAAIIGSLSAQKALLKMGLLIDHDYPKPAGWEQRKIRDDEIIRRLQTGQRACDVAREMGIHPQFVYNQSAKV